MWYDLVESGELYPLGGGQLYQGLNLCEVIEVCAHALQCA